jgi:hypothetical protein
MNKKYFLYKANLALTKLAKLALTKLAKLALTKLVKLALTKLAKPALTKLAKLALTKLAMLALTKLANKCSSPHFLFFLNRLHIFWQNQQKIFFFVKKKNHLRRAHINI